MLIYELILHLNLLSNLAPFRDITAHTSAERISGQGNQTHLCKVTSEWFE